MDAKDLARLLSYREAAASRALGGETMHEAAPRGDCCLDHAMERIAVLEELLRRWVGQVSAFDKWYSTIYVKATKAPWYICLECGGAGSSLATVDHAPACIVGVTLKALEVDGDDAE